MADNVTVLISGARIIDPANGIDAEGDILIERGHIAAVGSLDRAGASGAEVIEAKGLVACPGFVDIHCHLREPGPTGSETVLSGSRAAAGRFARAGRLPETARRARGLRPGPSRLRRHRGPPRRSPR
jgi:dihydroorotase